jgi:UDP-N-acetylmuramate dehydrogenase
MQMLRDVPLKLHSTMRLGGTAAYMADIHDRRELQEALSWAEQGNLPVLMIGSGSNIIWRDEGFPGLILVNKIMRFEEQQEDEENYYVTVGGGENWDSVVARTVEKGMTGIEALSLIPGTTGATPVQNVGAYGQDISQTLVSVEAYDRQAKQFVSLPGSECDFGYRTSRFKTADRGRFFITAITLHLMHANPQPPFYAALQRYFDEHDLHDFTSATVRDAVIAIRQSKLPDPAKIANNGSFFANPIVDQSLLTQIQATYPEMPHWPTPDDRVKLSAAWLVETAGFKNAHDAETGMATWPQQALVLVNEKAQSTAQLLAFKQKIITKVQQLFEVTLEQEPELLP